MFIVEFDYICHKGSYAPIIPLLVKGKEWLEVWVFVDSGATCSIFEMRDAEGLELDLSNIKPQMVVVGDGSFIPVYFTKLPIKIREIEFDATIGFSERLGVGFNILGRKDIFEVFKVCFDDTKKVVSFGKEEGKAIVR